MKLGRLKQIIKEEVEDHYDIANTKINKMVGVKQGEGKPNVLKPNIPGYDKLSQSYDPVSDANIIIPSVTSGDATRTIRSKDEYHRWLKEFKDKYNEEPKFKVNGSKIDIINDAFVKWRQKHMGLRDNTK